jgi:large subunit ribosomal protein L5
LGVTGGIVEKEASIHVSNVAIYNSKTGKADRVGFRLEDEKKVRFFKSDGELVYKLESTMAKLHDFYKETVVAELAKQFGYKSVMQVPRIEKITLNMGLGEAIADKKVLESAQADMAAIAGQKPIVTVARKSVAGFKIREGYPIGCKVTLRGERMWEFLERLISITIPRIRDFRGLNAKSFDGRGNYSMGVKEQIIFPEIDFDKVDKVRGMDITITTSAETNEEGKALLTAFNFPFRK